MRYLVVVLLVLLAACTDSTGTTEAPATISSTTKAPTTTTTPTNSTAPDTVTPPSSTTTATPETDDPAADEPTVAAASPFVALPKPDEELPHVFTDVLIGGDGLLYIGDVSPTPRDHPNEGAFWHFDGATWQRTLLTEILPPSDHARYAHTTNLVKWNGEYVGFLSYFDEDFEGGPLLLTSADGRNWQLEDLLSSGAGSLGSIYPTPESPPWPGAIGMSHLTTTEDEIVAVGWISTDQGSAPTVWRSTDARSWSVTLLPNSDSDNEWASQIAVSDAGWLVTANGPYYSTNLLWFSPDGRDWAQVGAAFLEEDRWWSIGELAAGDSAFVVATMDFDGESTITQRWYSANGTVWEKVGEPVQGFGPMVAIGSSIVSLIQKEDALVVEASPDGEEWATVVDFDVVPRDPWSDYFRLGSIGDSLTLTRFQTTADYVPTSTSVWFDSPAMDVILVEPDDTLNVRDGVMAQIIGELEPAVTGVITTGRTDGAAGSLWIEILHEGRLGWVNSLYLAEPIDDFTDLDPIATVEEFAEKVFRNGEPIGPHVGRRGLNVSYWEPTRRWTRGDDPMSDPTVHIWGCPECSPDPGPTHHATFANWIGEGFLEAWDHPDRVIAIGGPTITDAELTPQHPRAQFRNLHYVAVHKPNGTDNQDWKSWYVYLEQTDGELDVVGIGADMWIP